SRQVTLGVERGLGAGLELRAELYRRRFDRLVVQQRETDAQRAERLAPYLIPPDMPPASALLEHRPTVFPESTGRGTGTGVELLLRRSGRYVAGSVSYAFSKTTQEDHG